MPNLDSFQYDSCIRYEQQLTPISQVLNINQTKIIG